MNLPIGHLLFATLIISSTACGGSSPPPICQPRAAWDTGRNQALAGQALNYQVGSMCQGASHSQFQSQLYAGYNDGLAQFCLPAMVQGHGRQDGRAGSAPRYNPQRYSICTRQDGFAQAYQAGYQIGVSEYCVPTGAEQAGYAAGQQGSPAQFDSRAYAVCPQQALEQMAGSYNQAHARGVAEYCGQAAGQARAQGLAIGQQGRATPLAASSYQLCSMAQIRAAYNEGTRAGLQEFCSPENAAQAGSQQGLSGAASNFDPRPYRSCSRQEQRAIGQAYSQSHARSMDNYCQGLVQTAVSRSRELGVAGQANQNSRIFGNCSRTTVSRARAAANQAYGQGLAQYCAAPNIESIGQREGSQGQLSGNALRQYRVCTPRLFASVQSRYQRGADAGLALFCGDDKLRQSARQVAKTSNRAPLPRAFGVCLQRYPDTDRAYQQILLQEREQVVATLCTYQRGETQGRQDARTGNRKRTAVPAFCDRNGFSIYLTGYLEGWNNKKGNLCSAIDAYQRGRRDAAKGRTRSYRAPDVCRGQANQLSNKYMEGYRDADQELKNARQRDRHNDRDRNDRDRNDRDRNDRDHNDRDHNDRDHNDRDHNDRDWDGDRNSPQWRELQRRRIAKRHADAKRAAYTVCLRKGYGPSSCNQVTNRVCLDKGYGPSSCNLPTRHLKAVNTCLQKGYGPSSCRSVTSVRCLEKGYGPSSCALTVPVHKAVDLCLDKGYGPKSCDGITNWECINQGYSPSSCR